MDKKLEFTKYLYQDLAWGPDFKKVDGPKIKNSDSNSEFYIKQSLKVMKYSFKDLKGKKVFNIGTGREAKVFAKYGCEVFHMDLGEDTVKETKKWAKKNKKKIVSITADISEFNLDKKKFDIIFLAGLYQHLKVPAIPLIKFMNALKKGGIMYLGFYRSGEFKYFVVDAIRHIVNIKLIKKIKSLNSIVNCFAHARHLQSSRVMDDFYVPFKHNFHPKDIIHDVKVLGGKVFYIDNDMREYNHDPKKYFNSKYAVARQDTKNYFSLGADRIYVKSTTNKTFNEKKIFKKLKTKKGKNQIFNMNYKDKLIKNNIKLVKLIKSLYSKKYFDDEDIVALTVSMYQFARPFDMEKSYYYKKSITDGRHETMNLFLKNFIKNFKKSKKKSKFASNIKRIYKFKFKD